MTAPVLVTQAILCSRDEYLINVVYSMMVDLWADADLLQYHGPGLGESTNHSLLPGNIHACDLP
jgi:hypothetical protein